ncbi:CD3324 family protein [Paenibacillus flagellatus]|uniref:Mor transcription activator domain-containing protein n=1 Tax=Paenibacillus flagellatus TaxID=2211139 RepID=A0A2V5K842_9BACL|nr:CD3324 family protein [Paenibacillus flagellatus]PYI55528.1 hypothetical protein DLM86_07285 [Paenibacillus flagellatus]
MEYTDATVILPKELVEKVQQFVQGEYLFIPARKDCRSREARSGKRAEIDRRNSEIIQSYTSGMSVEELAQTYTLSIYAIQKIIHHFTLKK